MRRIYKALLADRVIVTTKSGKSFGGVVWEEMHDLLVLRDARVLDRNGEVEIDGDLILDRAQIEFIQRVNR